MIKMRSFQTEEQAVAWVAELTESHPDDFYIVHRDFMDQEYAPFYYMANDQAVAHRFEELASWAEIYIRKVKGEYRIYASKVSYR